jgi:hypothetical protein
VLANFPFLPVPDISNWPSMTARFLGGSPHPA